MSKKPTTMVNIREDRKRITLIEKYLNSEAAILYIGNFGGGSSMKPLMDSFNIESSILIGNPTKVLQDRIIAYGVKPRKLIGCWTN